MYCMEELLKERMEKNKQWAKEAREKGDIKEAEACEKQAVELWFEICNLS